MKHLFVDISSHGLGHLAQTAPILNALAENRSFQFTVRSGLTQKQLAQRICPPFTHIHEASDFGFVMHDALNVDIEASAERYRAAYLDWPLRVADEATMLARYSPDLVLSNVSALPLAGAAMAGIPAIAMCSLNWADLFAHYYDTHAWAEPIHAAMQSAYANAAAFLRFTPGMAMESLPNLIEIGPVSAYPNGQALKSRAEVARKLGLPQEKRWLLLAMGGIAHRLPVENWPTLPNTQLLVSADWQVGKRDDITAYDNEQLPFSELLPSVDIVLTKPGYGTFVEAACCGIEVLYLRRPDWPEADCLEAWLQHNARALAVPAETGISGDLTGLLETLLQQDKPARPVASGIDDALRAINDLLDEGDRIKT